ncbi:MAG: DUF2877 domain-containing protein [Anaerolineaceae bacterium]|nr:DUF2877 domain-containing protein [Anaerolineaceae bacterium]
MQINIDSVSSTIRDELAVANPLGVVHSVFDRAVNIQLNGIPRIIALTFTSAGRLPYALMVGDDQLDDFLSLNISTGLKVYQANGSSIRIENIEDYFVYSNSAIWDPHMDPLDDPKDTRGFLDLLDWSASHVFQRANRIGLVPLLENPRRLLAGLFEIDETPDLRYARLASPIISRLLTALNQMDRPSLTEETGRLLGYGIGGTPSGDDLLVGLLAALTRSSHPTADRLLHLLVDTLISQLDQDVTSLLSLTVLNHAVKGAFSEKIHTITRLLMHPEGVESLETGLENMLLHGASSGSEMFLGIYLGFMLLYHKPAEEYK